jgi:putative ABC transport system ATP-binding protein
MRAVIALDHVVKDYAGPPGVRALDDVTLDIEPGELVAVSGRSGSGKSTLLHLMGTLDSPTRGTVRVAGHDTRALRPRQLAGLRGSEIGFVFQQFCLIDGLSALDNVATGLLYRDAPSRERRRRADIALERVGLSARRDHRSSDLSGGERQRVAIARAIVGRPSVILADEPTGNLDSTSGEAIVDLLAGLRDDGATLVVVTHDASVTARCERTIVIADGQVAP